MSRLSLHYATMLLLEKARYTHQFRRVDGAYARSDYPQRDDKQWME